MRLPILCEQVACTASIGRDSGLTFAAYQFIKIFWLTATIVGETEESPHC